METYTLNEKTKESIKRTVGINVDDISDMDTFDIDQSIERKIGKKLKHQTKFKSFTSRGSVFIELGRLLGIDAINKKLSRI